jgi:C4-dicarboxylate transporter, DctM subunit
MLILILSLFFFISINIPLAISIGLSSLVYILLTQAMPITLIAQRMVAGVDSFPLLSIPFFLLAGTLMAEAKITPHIMHLANSFVGQIKGGLAMVMVLSCMFFGAISGSGVADVMAIGSVLLPAMKKSGYKPEFSVSLLGCSGSLGTIIPPSVTMVIIGVTAGISIGKLFLGGIIPGIITGFSLMILSYFLSIKIENKQEEFFSLRKILHAFKDALLSLMMPLIIIGGILTGIFTPTEAAAVAVVYALFLGIFIYRTIKIKLLPSMILSTVETSATILFIIASASIFGWVLAAEQIPQHFADSVLSLSDNYYLVIFFINIMLLILGMFMETISIIIIVVPVLMPVINSLGMDPVHFGVMLTVNLAVGANTPPVGVDLLAACRVGGVRLEETLKYVTLFVGMMVAALIPIILFPSLVLLIPNYFV